MATERIEYTTYDEPSVPTDRYPRTISGCIEELSEVLNSIEHLEKRKRELMEQRLIIQKQEEATFHELMNRYKPESIQVADTGRTY